MIDEYFIKNGIVPTIKYEVETVDRMLSYINDGFGVGFLLKQAVDEKNKDLVIIDTDIESNICISYIKEKLTPSTKEFLKLFDSKE